MSNEYACESCECVSCMLKFNVGILNAFNESFDIDYPYDSLQTFARWLTPACRSYVDVANGHSECLDKDETKQIYKASVPVLTVAIEKTCPTVANRYAKRMDYLGDNLSGKGNYPSCEMMAFEILGASYCYFDGADKIYLALSTLPQKLDPDSYIGIDEINKMFENLYNNVFSWKDKYDALKGDDRHLIQDIYGSRYDPATFPYTQGSDDEIMWVPSKDK